MLRFIDSSLRPRALGAGLALALSALLPQPAAAIDVAPGDYTAAPPGTNLVLVYYQFAHRDALYADGDKLPGKNSLDSTVGILRAVHFAQIGGYTIDPQILLPFGRLSASDDASALGSNSGFGDPILAMTLWLLNDAQSGRYFGIAPYLFLPFGQYERKDALNLGENRWAFALQAGFITPLWSKTKLDLTADAKWFGDNNDYGAGSARLETSTLYHLQAALRFQVSDKLEISPYLSWRYGGENRVDGRKLDDRTNTTNFLLSATYQVTPSDQLQLQLGRDLDVDNGFEEQSRINLRYMKVF